MDMSGNNKIYVKRIKYIHEDVPYIADAVLCLLIDLILTVCEDILMHEDDLPWGVGRSCIPFQPVKLLLL